MSIRELTLELLREKFAEKAEAIEKKMNSNVVFLAKERGMKPSKTNEEFLAFAKEYYYDMLGLCLNDNTKPGAVVDLNSKKYGFKLSIFSENLEKEKSFVDNSVNPKTVVTGIVKCKECGSMNTNTMTAQLSSGDEITKSLVDCIDCRAHFVTYA